MKTATLGIILRGNKILLGWKKSGEIGTETFNGPGGKCDPVPGENRTETPLECMVREAKEEAGIVLDPEFLEEVAVLTFYAGGEPSFKVHVFRTEVFSGEPKETESMVPEWFDIAEIPYERMLKSDSTWFPRVITTEVPLRANVYYQKKAEGFLYTDFLPSD